MKNSYSDLINQTFDWPALDFNLADNQLHFHGIPLQKLIDTYGTPLKLTYIPKIGAQVEKARKLFAKAMQKYNYKGKYTYCYCTKSSHFSHVLDEVLNHGSHIETSSAFDIDLVRKLFNKGKIDKDIYIVCNGFKMPEYIEKIAGLINDGFKNVIPVLDNLEELKHYFVHTKKFFRVGIRIAAEEEPNFEFYTSRLGIRYKDILPFFRENIKENPQVELSMLHFFINTGIRDTAYYWSELSKCVSVYCNLKKECEALKIMDIGGGFPVPNSLYFDYDYQYMTETVIASIKKACDEEKVAEPDIFTEFGSFTVAESSATLFTVISEKLQNDAERWYMIDGSFITALPDSWGIGQRFIALAVNHWDKEYQRVNLGGLTCDSMDYYNSEIHVNQVFLPKIPKGDKLCIGFFNTGAYQEALGGYGGIQHCLIPAAKHVLADLDENGKLFYRIFAPQQTPESMLNILGYTE